MAEKKATSLDRYLLLCDQLLVFLVKRFSIKFQFSNCNILVTCHIDSATPRYQPTLLEKSQIDPCLFILFFSNSINTEHTEQKNSKKEQKQTRYKNTIHLWEFLLELLEDERYIPLISWTRKEEGEFKIKRQEEVARRWGRLKQRAGMNYDKLSRALRYYYQKGIIKKVSNQKVKLCSIQFLRTRVQRLQGKHR